jgi:cardiolipin synthase A/B
MWALTQGCLNQPVQPGEGLADRGVESCPLSSTFACTGGTLTAGPSIRAWRFDWGKAERTRQSVDLVWTGPMSKHVPVRHTRAVLLEVIAAARHELLLVSYAAFRVEAVLEALRAADARGVAIALGLESTEDSGGALTIDAARAFTSVRDHITCYVWPAERQPQLGGGIACLHAKAAVADDTVALITSANLTAHAITANMELGLLVRGGSVPRRLRLHFRELIADKTLVPMT